MQRNTHFHLGLSAGPDVGIGGGSGRAIDLRPRLTQTSLDTHVHKYDMGMLFLLLLLLGTVALTLAAVRYVTRRSRLYRDPHDLRRAGGDGADGNFGKPDLTWIVFGSGHSGT